MSRAATIDIKSHLHAANLYHEGNIRCYSTTLLTTQHSFVSILRSSRYFLCRHAFMSGLSNSPHPKRQHPIRRLGTIFLLTGSGLHRPLGNRPRMWSRRSLKIQTFQQYHGTHNPQFPLRAISLLAHHAFNASQKHQQSRQRYCFCSQS